MKRLLTSFLIPAIAVTVIRCADPGPIGPDAGNDASSPLKGLVISNSHRSSVGTATVGRASTSFAGDEGVVFISLAPGTLPDAVEVQVENRTRSLPTLLVSAVEGGFDPVAVPATAGDTIALLVRMSDGRREPITVKVPTKRPPSVVRTNPPRGRTDVALNVIVAVVFTEPVDRTTVNTSSVRLLQDGRAVNGTVILGDNSWEAEFLPDNALDPESAYELVVTRQVRDLDGDPLDGSLTASFVTGTSRCAETLGKRGCIQGIEGNRAITGTVTAMTANGLLPVPNASISPWMWVDGKTGYKLEPFQSDADGKYTLTSLPEGKVQLHVDVAGLDQPCGVVAKLTQPSVTADIQLVESGSWAVRPTGKYTVWGHLGVHYVRIVFESPEHVVAATATSDGFGNFALCNLPSFGQTTLSRTFLSVSKTGWETVRWNFDIGGSYEMWMTMTPENPSP